MKKGILKATHQGQLKLNGINISCAVLEDGTRVISERSLATALGIRGGGAYWEKKKSADDVLPEYIAVNNVQPFISEALKENLSKSINYIPKVGKITPKGANGFKAEVLPEICDVWINAEKHNALTESQKKVAENAYVILKGFAKVGIIALVDEATGYQYERERFELQKILEAYVSDEILKWQLTFTDEFYKEVYRLWGLPFIPKYIKNKPSFIGKLTTKYVYDLLPKGVVEKIKEQTGKTEKGNWKYKWHQSLKPEVGKEHLKKQIIEITTLMSISQSKEQFNGLFEQKYHKKPVQLLMEFNEEPPKEEKLSDFNQKLKTALEFNPKDDIEKAQKH